MNRSPHIIGAVGMLSAVGGFGLSYYLGLIWAGPLGAILGLCIGIGGLTVALQTGRSIRLSVNAIVLSVVFLVGSFAIDGLNQPPSTGPSRAQQLLQAESRLSFAVIDRDSAQRMVEGEQAKRDANRLRPELLDRIVLVEVKPLYIDRVDHVDPTIVIRRLHVDFTFRNDTEFDLTYYEFALSMFNPDYPDREPRLSDWGGGIALPAGKTGTIRWQSGSFSKVPAVEAAQSAPPTGEQMKVQIIPISAGLLKEDNERVPLIHTGLAYYQQKRLDGYIEQLREAQAEVDEAERQLQALR